MWSSPKPAYAATDPSIKESWDEADHELRRHHPPGDPCPGANGSGLTHLYFCRDNVGQTCYP
jgi:hypothetical protein